LVTDIVTVELLTTFISRVKFPVEGDTEIGSSVSRVMRVFVESMVRLKKVELIVSIDGFINEQSLSRKRIEHLTKVNLDAVMFKNGIHIS